MKERKTIKKVLTRYVPKCINITFGDMVQDYDKELNKLIQEEYDNGWDLVEYTTKVGEYEANIVYNLIFEKYEIKEDDNNVIADLIPHIYGCENKRTIIDTSGDDEFKQLIQAEYLGIPGYIKNMIDKYKIKYNFNITRDYECIDMSTIYDWIEKNKNEYDIPKPIPQTDTIVGTITITCTDDNVRGFITYSELLKFNNTKYIVRTSIKENTNIIKVVYFKPYKKEGVKNERK